MVICIELYTYNPDTHSFAHIIIHYMSYCIITYCIVTYCNILTKDIMNNFEFKFEI